ncbi:MAG: hypothetical protein FWF54_08810 [Candidatus Azobacteroides sp.]|nr:hypothetical protein [Candidatus Azobacteroides sp.]
MKNRIPASIITALLLISVIIQTHLSPVKEKNEKWQSKLISIHNNGKILYEKDEYGFVIPDFSHSGYDGGNREMPDVPVIKIIQPQPGDNTAYIQQIIDSVGTLPLDEKGFRGAILLNAGIYDIYGTLYVKHDGIVLRGKGDDYDPTQNTIIRARGNTPKQRDVIVLGNDSVNHWEMIKTGSKQNIITPKVNPGDFTFEVEDVRPYQVGDQIMIYHPCTDKWLKSIDYGGVPAPFSGEEDERWTENLLPIIYNRYITQIDGNQITIDAPVFYTLNRTLSQSYVYKPDMTGTVYNIGLENVQINIETAGKEDENHAWQCVRVQSAENGRIKNCTMLHFGQSGIITNFTSRFTIENCKAINPVSLIIGDRRYNFNTYIYSQQILLKNCYAKNGRHHYVSNGTSTASGIVFLRCISDASYNVNEGHRKWTSGMLYDNLKEINIRPVTGWRKIVYHTQCVLGLYNRENIGTGHGWSAVQSVCWNCDVNKNYGKIVIQKPPTAQNYAIGCKAKEITGKYTMSSTYAPGYIEGQNKVNLEPESLFEAQLRARKH